MTVILPAFVDSLLQQGQELREIPDLPRQTATGWLEPLASCILSSYDSGSHRPAGSFYAHGSSHLPLPASVGQACYLRVGKEFGRHPWPVHTTSVVLTMAGVVDLEVYREVPDSLTEQPLYARSFGPQEVFAVHPGTICSTRTSSDDLQVLVTAEPLRAGAPPLPGYEFGAITEEARNVLQKLAPAARAGAHS